MIFCNLKRINEDIMSRDHEELFMILREGRKSTLKNYHQSAHQFQLSLSLEATSQSTSFEMLFSYLKAIFFVSVSFLFELLLHFLRMVLVIEK